VVVVGADVFVVDTVTECVDAVVVVTPLDPPQARNPDNPLPHAFVKLSESVPETVKSLNIISEHPYSAEMQSNNTLGRPLPP